MWSLMREPLERIQGLEVSSERWVHPRAVVGGGVLETLLVFGRDRLAYWAETPGCLQASSFWISSWEIARLSSRLPSSRSRTSRISRSESHSTGVCHEPSPLWPPSVVIRCRWGCHCRRSPAVAIEPGRVVDRQRRAVGSGRGVATDEAPEPQQHAAEDELVTIRQPNGVADRLPAHEGPVAAAAVLERSAQVADTDDRVATGDTGVVHPYRRLLGSPEDVLARPQEDLPLSPEHSTVPPALPGRAVVRLRLHVAAERVPEPGDRPYPPRPMRMILQRLAQLVHQHGEVGLGHVEAGPQPLLDLVLGHGSPAALDQKAEQLEGLRGQVDSLPVAREPPGKTVEDELAKPEARDALPVGPLSGNRRPN
jgi:hypothetical protein